MDYKFLAIACCLTFFILIGIMLILIIGSAVLIANQEKEIEELKSLQGKE